MAAAVQGLMEDRRQRERPLIAVSHRLPGDRRSVEEADGAFQTATLSLPPDEPQSAQTETAFIVLEKRGWGNNRRYNTIQQTPFNMYVAVRATSLSALSNPGFT